MTGAFSCPVMIGLSGAMARDLAAYYIRAAVIVQKTESGIRKVPSENTVRTPEVTQRAGKS